MPLLLGATFTWVGHGADPNWSTCGNWLTFGIGGGCFPAGADTAKINYSPTPRDITIDGQRQVTELLIAGSVNFTGSGGNSLSAATMTIDGGNGGTTVTVQDTLITTLPTVP